MNIDGNKIQKEILDELREEIKKRDLKLKLAAVLVGNDPGSRKFLELKGKAAQGIGIGFKMYEFPEDISTNKLREALNNIVKAGVNSGVIIELPLPEHINNQYILNTIPPQKDPDVLSTKSQGNFFVGKSKILPPAVEAVKIVFEKTNLDVKGKHVVVFGYGFLVGKPVTHWLKANGATVSVIDEFTKNPGKISKEADIIISGVGKVGLIKKDMVKDGVVVIDFGYVEEDGKIMGDVDFEAVSERSSMITPVPGGMGPLVIAAVLKNLVALSGK